MRDRGSAAPARNRARARQERGLNRPTFVGSFPAADFQLPAVLPEIAFVGRSNVGKSSLINAVSGARGLARVSKTPGKTRACNVFDVEGRWYLVDLPGYGFARASHDDRTDFHRLLNSYVTRRERLAGVVWLLDIRRELSADDLEMAESFAARSVPVLAVITKADKLPQGQRATRVESIVRSVKLPADQHVVTSTLSGEGVEDLRDSIEALVRTVRRSDDRTMK